MHHTSDSKLQFKTKFFVSEKIFTKIFLLVYPSFNKAVHFSEGIKNKKKLN